MKITGLPFVKDSPRGSSEPRNWWSVKPSGDYVEECNTGQRYAALFFQVDKETLNAGGFSLLGQVVMGMIRAGDTNGIVVGFFSSVAHAYSPIVSGNFPNLYPAQLEKRIAKYDAARRAENQRQTKERSERARKAANARWAKQRKRATA